jgi:hypothetical protein
MVSITADFAKKRATRSIEILRNSMKEYHEAMLREIEEKIFSSSGEGETSVSFTTHGPCNIEMIKHEFETRGFEVRVDGIGGAGTMTRIRLSW